MNPEITTTGAILAGLAALVTAASAGMARIITELRKISNGNMQRIDDRLAEIAKLERANLMMGGKIVKAIRQIGGYYKPDPDAKPKAKQVALAVQETLPLTIEGDGKDV